MKILHVITSCHPRVGGPIEGIRQLSKYYKKYNIFAHILCSDKPGEKHTKDKTLPKIYAVGPGKFAFAYNPRLFNWLQKNIDNYDLIIINGIWQYHNFAVWKNAKKKNIPYYVIAHGMLDPWFNHNYPLKFIKKIFYWWIIQYWVLKNAKKILFTTKEEGKLAKKSFVPFPKNCVTMGYGISGYKKNRGKNLFKIKYPNLNKKKILLYLSRIAEKKGLDLLIHAFNEIKENKIHLVIAGNNQNIYAQKIKDLIKKKKLENFITWVGPLHGKIKWDALRSASLFCLPSHQENFGIVITESLSCGTPVLITNKVNIYNIIKKYNAGFVNNNTVNGTLISLNKWKKITKTKNYLKIINNAKNCFNENFKSEKVVQNLVKIFKN